MREATKKWTKFTLRWGIAVVGIFLVLRATAFFDTVHIIGPGNRPIAAKLAEEVPDHFTAARIVDPTTGQTKVVSRDELVNMPDSKWVEVIEPTRVQRRKLLALDLTDNLKAVRRFLVEGAGGNGEWVAPDRVLNYNLGVPHPLVDQGIIPMVRHAQHWYLWCAIAIF